MNDVTTGRFTISMDKRRLDVDAVHDALRQKYWSKEIPKAIVRRAIEHSLCFGVYEGPRQIGFARVISDYATFAYLADVYIDDACRGQGLGKELIACIMSHEQLQGLRRWMLATQDAHGLYEQYGFVRAQHPERLMEIVDPDIYVRMSKGENGRT
jgi:N-acetylglutamate synthase-like GNAT family acetyltransferase